MIRFYVNKLLRHSFFAFLFPHLYVEEMEELDLEKYNEEYEWELDPLNGLLDHAQKPSKTVEKSTGDCVDYAFLVLSTKSDKKDIYLVTCLNWFLFPRHMVVWDGEKVYSSGNIYNKCLEEYIEDSEYKYSVKRKAF